MAGDWIKMRMDLPDDPAVIGISERTGLDGDTVVGKLFRIWSWANRQTIDGNVSGVTEAWLDRYIGVTGFAQAMVEVGWLDTTSGGIALPDFERHNSETAKQRALTAIRVRRHRNAPIATKALPEKRREEKSKKNPFDPLEITLPFSSEAFRQAWSEFCQHRLTHDGGKHPLTELAATKLLKKCGQFGESAAIEAINTAIENDWRGIFPSRDGGKVASPQRPNGRVYE